MDPHTAALNRARDFTVANRLDQARQVLARLLQRAPRHPEGNAAMAYVALREGRRDQAVFYAERSMAAAAPGSELYAEAAKILGHAGQRDRAITALESVAAGAPAALAARVVLSMQYLLARRPAAAARIAREGLGLDPANADLANNLGMGMSQSGRATEAVETLRRAVERHPDNLMLRSNLALTMNYCAGVPADAVLEAHRGFARALERQVPRGVPPGRTPDPERLVTVGFLSPDFVAHSVESFIGPVCEHLDPARFRVECFSTASEAEADTPRRPRVAAYHAVHDLDDAALAGAIRERGIDVLIELSGHTMGGRPPVLRRRPAPVQATYLGYPNTTGVAEIGYRFVDSLTDPGAGADARATERLVRVDPCFLCFRPSAGAPEPVAPPCTGPSGAPVTFGSFNSLSKVNEFVVTLWSRVLGAVRGSRLLLKGGGLTELEACDEVRERFRAAGVDPGRLELVGWQTSAADHLAMYHRVDVALDTFPYHGTTTTAEALWMGVPVVSLVGEVHSARVGLSILSAAGHPEWAAPSADEYVRRAAELASDPGGLTALRAGLRGRVRSSILTDGAAMGRRFGEALRGVWRDWCRGQASK